MRRCNLNDYVNIQLNSGEYRIDPQAIFMEECQKLKDENSMLKHRMEALEREMWELKNQIHYLNVIHPTKKVDLL